MWSRPDTLDRLAQALVALAALFAAGNGLYMLIDPFGWYEWVGTVKASGPPNGHFIRDIGLAYLVCAALLGYAAGNLPMRWAAGLAGASWLALHGGLHIWEVAKGLCSPGIFWKEAPGTLGPPLIALAGIGIQMMRQRISSGPVPGRIIVSTMDKLTFGLSPHLADLAKAPGHVVEKFAHFMPFGLHQHDASTEQVFMARLGAAQIEGCGPCVEIVARGAAAAGLPRDVVNAALAGNLAQGPAAQALAFGRAVAAHSPDLDELGEAIEAQWGRSVRTELAIAAAVARVHPALKRGLGYTKACPIQPLEV